MKNADYYRERRKLYEDYCRSVEELKARYGVSEREREIARKIIAGDVTRRVSRAVRGLTGDFTHHDVLAEVRRVEGTSVRLNRVSVATCLRRLTRGRHPLLTLVESGVGRRAAVYRRARPVTRPVSEHPWEEEREGEEDAPF